MEEEDTSGGRAPNGNFAATVDDIGAEVSQQLERLREEAGELGARLVEFIRERPGTSLLIAAAAGYLVGRFLRS